MTTAQGVVAAAEASAAASAEGRAVAALVQCVLVGGGGGSCTLTVRDLCNLGALCRSAQRCAEATPSFWSEINLSGLRTPSAFFSGGHSRATRFHNVISLTLQFCDDITDSHLALLPPKLRRLTLDACHRVTDGGIKAVARSCGRNLELLSVYWSNHISDSGVLSLGLRCPALTALSLSGSKNVGSNGILSLASRCHSLATLNLTRLPKVDDGTFAEARAWSPHIP